jgi:hydroxypyruvate reductase
MDAERLMNDVLRAHPRGALMADIMASALRAVEPAAAVGEVLRGDGGGVGIGDQLVPLDDDGRIVVAGAGKAGAFMAAAAVERLGDRIAEGVVVVKDGHRGGLGSRVGRIDLLEAQHPVPDARGVAAAERIAGLAGRLTGRDVLLVLLSGGGSALLTLPAEGLTLADLQATTDALLRAGASIQELNAVRKHCSQLAGGGLARLAAPATVVSLIISDVVGSPLDVIASGPTAPDPTTFGDAWAIVERFQLAGRLPPAVVGRLERGRAGEVSETVKPADPLWSRVRNVVVASNRTAAEAAVRTARERDLDAAILTTFLEGEAREVGAVAAAIARERAGAPAGRPMLVVAGGETTVTVRGQGLGGRNLEVALGAVAGLAGLEGVLFVTLATDGGDGPTDAAGAAVTGSTLAAARARGLGVHEHLAANDSYRFFEPLGALLRPGPTLTNVNDLMFLLVEGR